MDELECHKGSSMTFLYMLLPHMEHIMVVRPTLVEIRSNVQPLVFQRNVFIAIISKSCFLILF